ncbi:MAG TPA: cold shock domain-containing protein, partial [Chitinophagales bacterium]|nr:cold shock domain-containing protein [Chitinophagales bacterium]
MSKSYYLTALIETPGNDVEKVYSGTVIFFLKEKGFGAIQTQELGSVYLHFSKLTEGYKFARPGDEVLFHAVESQRKRGVYEALEVKFVKNDNLALIVASMENKTPIRGLVVNMNAGGLLMKILGIDAFLPKSEVDIYEFNSHRFLLNKTID